MYMILSKMFDWFTNKNKRLQSKIDKYIDLENQKQVLKSQVDECADNFVERKTSLDELIKSESDQSIKDSVQERYDNYISGYIVEIGDLKRNRDRIESEMNNLIKGDEDFLNLVKKEKEVRKFKSILSKYRSNDIDLDACDALIKAVSKKKVDYADNLVFNEKGELLLLKRSELAEFKPGHYTIPGGHVDPGEDFETAAKRELLEESGIKSGNIAEVGKYENEDVCIHYFLSNVNNVEPILQEEEIWSYEWADPKELEKYKMMDNMRDNIVKILFPVKHQIITINKSFESGVISEEQKDALLDVVLEKAKSKYELKLERQAIRKKDPDFFVEKYHEWNNQSEVPSYSKPSVGSVLEFFQNNYEDFSNDDELKEMVLKRLNKSEEGDIEKAKSGIYKPTNENKKLGRVGQKYGNKKEVSKYQKIKDYAEQVIRGEKYIKRLSPEEEQGRIRGGRANVEATLLIGTDERASDGSKEAYERRPIQEAILEDYAKKNNFWIERLPEFNSKNFIDSGAEARVYKYGNNNVVKINNLSQHEEPIEFLDRVAIHNFIFPDTKYEVLGFMKNEDGDFCVVVKQPFITGNGGVSRDEVVKEMKEMGFKHEGGNSYMSNDYLIDDLHKGNVLQTKYGLAFIDPIIYLNKKGDGYGGDRELGKIKFEKSEEQDIEKAESFKNEKTEDDIPVDKFFENKFEEKYKVFYEAVKKYLWDKWEVKSKKEFDDKFSKESKLKEVDIDDICPTQKYVSKKILDEKMKNDHFKSSKIQLLKLDGEYFLYDGHHRTCAMIEEGYNTVKEEVLKLNKIKDFEKDIEEYLPEDYDLYDIVGKSVVSDLNKAFDLGFIDEQTYDSLLEKAWKKQPIGTVTTRKDGKKYRKVSETGNMDQDWKLVSKDKTGMAKDKPEQSGETKQVETKQSKENLQELAKNTSETALNNAIKQSPDPEVRQTAHEELQRRENEEKPKEEEKKDVKKENKSFDEWFEGSKVVDENGKPLEVYHGTDEDFENFSKESVGKKSGDYSLGFYFSSSRDEALKYSKNKGVIKKSFLKITNPLIEVIDESEDTSLYLDKNRGNIARKIIASRKNNNEFDGVIVKNKEKSTYLVFNEDQIKIKEDKKDTQKSEETNLEKAKDQIEGGLADKLSIEQIAEKHGVSVKKITKQIKKGVKVEMEHTDDPTKAAEIAKDHLTEDPKYYTRLAKMEDEAKKENKD